MSDESNKISDLTKSYGAIPIRSLILDPILAASEGGTSLAKSTLNFLNEIGFDEKGKTRCIEVEIERMTKGDSDTLVPVKQTISTPVLSLVQIPNVGITDVDITFDMEISSHSENTSSTNSTKTDSSTTEAHASASGKVFGIGFDIGGSHSSTHNGSVTTASSQIRSTDFSSRYSVHAVAKDLGCSEGMSKLTQMLAQQMDVVDTAGSSDK